LAVVIDPVAPEFENTTSLGGPPPFAYAPAHHDVVPALTFVTPFTDSDASAFAGTARSVHEQSLQHWEWLIVEHGSARQVSSAFLRRLSEDDPRITVLRNAGNRGIAAARNTGVHGAGSSFVLHVDSGDVIEPTAAEKCLWFLTSYPEYWWVNGSQVASREHERASPSGSQGSFPRDGGAVPLGMARRELFGLVGGFDETLAAGMEYREFWKRCAALGVWRATIPEYLGSRRGERDDADRSPCSQDEPREKPLLQGARRRYRAWRAPSLPRVDPAAPRVPSTEDELSSLALVNPLAKSRRRLLLIVPWVTTGGADKFNLDLATQLRARDWELTVVTTLHGDNSWAPRLARITPDIFLLENFLKPHDFPRFLNYVCESRGYDAILISNSVFAYTALPYLRKIASNIPIVDFCHSIHPAWLNGGYPRLSVNRSDLLDLQIVSSAHLAEWMTQQGAHRDRVEICYTNVDANREPAHHVSVSADSNRSYAGPVIVYPCRIDVEKQPRVFAGTMRELHQRGHAFRALVVGDGPYLDWLRRYVVDHDLTHVVRFVGRVSSEESRRLIAASDCLFLPSQFEGISLTFFEAMAEGVAVVGADVGGQRELVTAECGVLIERADEASEVARYADALDELLANPTKLRAMGEAGRSRVREHFALDDMGTRMDALLGRASELAATNPRRTPDADEAYAAALAATRDVAWAAPWTATLIGEPHSMRLRWHIFRLGVTIGMPIHRLAMRLGFHWIEGVRQRVANLLLPKSH
jgi:glycosyltransferase involved in cell wall biosynthesis